QGAVVEAVLRIGGAVRLADRAPGVAREQILELVVPRPRGERVGGIHADGDEDYIAAVVKQLCVLITVRMHLNRSALGSRLIEEGEDDRFPLEIAQVDRSPQHAVARRARKREVGRGRADLERLRRLGRLLRARRGGDERHGQRECEKLHLVFSFEVIPSEQATSWTPVARGGRATASTARTRTGRRPRSGLSVRPSAPCPLDRGSRRRTA